jgi:hypothetical protein
MRRGISKHIGRGLWKKGGKSEDSEEASDRSLPTGGSIKSITSDTESKGEDVPAAEPSIKRRSVKKGALGIFGKKSNEASEGSRPMSMAVRKTKNVLQMPKDATLLSSCKIEDLYYFCELKNIDHTQLEDKKAIVKALAATYPPKQPRVVYLRIKEIETIISENKSAHNAYKVVKDKAKEDKIELDKSQFPKPPPLDPALVAEIDTLFDTLIEKLEVQVSLRGVLSRTYSTEDKITHLLRSVCVFDDHPHFSQEDEDMITVMDSERSIDSIRLLTCKYRIMHSNEDWMSNFCMSGGISVLVENMDNRLEKEPLESNDAAALYELLLCLKEIMKTDGLKVALETRGAIDAFVMSLRFEYKPLALEVLGLLAVVCTFGGTEAVWQTVMGLRHLARKRNEEMFAVLVDAMTTQVTTYLPTVLDLVFDAVDNSIFTGR